MSFKRYIKAVGTGIKGNRDLELEEIQDAIKMILNKEVSNEQIGAFLVGIRVKLESDLELKGTLDTLKSYIKNDKKIEESIELGFSYDGKTNTPYLFPLYGKILKDFFAKNKDIKPFDIVVSGDFLQPAKVGVTLKDIATNVELEDNIHFFDRSEYLKELSDLTTLRNNLGLRTIFNTVEKLLNPASSKYAITSAFHGPYVKKYRELFANSYENFLVVKGKEGTTEFFDKCKYWTYENEESVLHDIDLAELGINYEKSWDKITLDEALEEIKNPDEQTIKLAKLNVAFLLYTTNRVADIKEAYSKLEEL